MIRAAAVVATFVDVDAEDMQQSWLQMVGSVTSKSCQMSI